MSEGNTLQGAICDVPSCDREWSRGWCVAHYFRWRRSGEVRPDEPVGAEPSRACAVHDCGRTHYSRGWCEAHYRRWRRSGTTERQRAEQPTVACSVAGCDEEVDARGWCHGHHQRWLRKGDVEAHIPLGRRRQPETCEIDGCDRASNAHGLCRAHRTRQREHGDPLADEPVRTPTGEGCISHGYRKVPVPPDERHLTDGETPALERLVMTRHLGRALAPHEVVHHINGDRLDNRIGNLELWSTSHPRGQRVRDKVDHAIEILARYRPHLLALPNSGSRAGEPAPRADRAHRGGRCPP